MSPAQTNEGGWDLRLAELVAYKEEHGDCNVPAKYTPNKQLGTWVAKQRRQYRLINEGKTSSMPEGRVAKLNEVGFEWNVSHLCPAQTNEGTWDLRLAELVAYKEEHGHCNVPGKHQANKQLGTWVAKQRYWYRLLKDGKTSQITQERIAKLNEVGFKWKLPPGPSGGSAFTD